ncbi:DUF4115 domain-containing protein [candidate division TA06 bacterium]|nr:DUF4115 domain-containing protein [candidate division TA06 bacterium]
MDSIGSRLQKAREKKHLSLKDVSEKTKIHPNVLKAIEEDRADQMLSRVYVKGFVRSYAALVGLHGEELVQAYQEVSKETPLLMPGSAEGSPWGEGRVFPWMRWSIVILFAAASLYGIRWGFSKIQQKLSFPSFSRQTLSLEKGSRTPYPFRLAPDEPMTLKLRAYENTWITVTSDGQLMYQGLLTKGREESWLAKRRFELSMSDGGVVEGTGKVTNGKT